MNIDFPNVKQVARKAFPVFIFVVLSLATGYIGYLFYLRQIVNSDRPELFGSDARLVAALKKNEHGDSYKFLVLADSNGNFPVEEDLIKPVADEIDFAVILGDAADSDFESHRYLKQTMRRLNLKTPFFYVPGNNDFDAGKTKGYQKRFTAEDFETEYGPLMFSFVYHGDMFIGICSIGNNATDEKSVAFLKSLEAKRRKYRHCFVFMHIPPPLPAFDNTKFTADERYPELFAKLNVDYVFASHYHGYQTTTSQGVNYIVTGGGGARLDNKKLPQFYHSIEFFVGPESISQRFVYSPEDVDFPDWLEVRSVLHVIPFFLTYRWFAFSVVGLICAAWVVLAYFTLAKRKSGDE
ncbi:MAG: hypothetical protein GXP32_08015 [Kiritimatiellaeota bacterium]|nr:hypothetical protein [Kiritimatiellota bacterium]